MSDGWVWIQCNGCKSNIRLIAFSGGNWGLWNEGLDKFIEEHSTEKCHGESIYNMEESRNGNSFFSLLNEKEVTEGAYLKGAINKH